MPVKHESDAQFDRIGATVSRQFTDVNGKVEVTRNPPDRDQYAGDGRTALGDAVTNYCANCEATERRNAELEAAIAAYAAQRVGEIEMRLRMRAELAKHQESEFHPDWSLLEATRKSLREHQEMLQKAQSLASMRALEFIRLRATVSDYVDTFEALMNAFDPTMAQMDANYVAFLAMQAAAGITIKGESKCN